MMIMINKLIYKGGVTKPFGKFITVAVIQYLSFTVPGILNPGGWAFKQSSSNRYSSMRTITRVSSCASHT